jgi:hypothetical protein
MFKVDKNADFNGASFHGVSFLATPAELKKAFGEPRFDDNFGHDKVNLEWQFSDENGNVATVYDWKEYRRLDDDDRVEWHIGGEYHEITHSFLEWVIAELKK